MAEHTEMQSGERRLGWKAHSVNSRGQFENNLGACIALTRGKAHVWFCQEHDEEWNAVRVRRAREFDGLTEIRPQDYAERGWFTYCEGCHQLAHPDEDGESRLLYGPQGEVYHRFCAPKAEAA